MVVDQQGALAEQRVDVDRGPCGLRRRRHHGGDIDRECRTLVRPAGQRDRAAHQVDQPATDRQAQPCAAETPRRRRSQFRQADRSAGRGKPCLGGPASAHRSRQVVALAHAAETAHEVGVASVRRQGPVRADRRRRSAQHERAQIGKRMVQRDEHRTRCGANGFPRDARFFEGSVNLPEPTTATPGRNESARLLSDRQAGLPVGLRRRPGRARPHSRDSLTSIVAPPRASC